jgi:CHAD domain-containing protein
MAYQLKEGEAFLEGLFRIGKEEQKAILASLSEHKNPHQGVHQARKHLKKLRALIRLIRDTWGEEQYLEANIYYRDIGRELSVLRDINSQIEISAKLRKQYAPRIGDEGFKRLIQLFLKERKKIQKKRMNEALFKEEVQRIKKDKDRFEMTKKSEPAYREKVLKSLTRVYRRGYRGFQKAQAFPETEALHDWRKRVKYLWHQFQLIEPAWPQLLRSYQETLKKLADALGDYHDLALLQEHLKALKKELPDGFTKQLYNIIQKEMDRQHRQALYLGKLLYSERPRAFRRRMMVITDVFFTTPMSPSRL